MKTPKQSRQDQYQSIVESKGKRWIDCKVLAFVFEYSMKTELFHYHLMEERHEYFLFDGWGKNANVVVPKDEQNTAKIVAIAAKLGGQKTTPNLR